jgi:putative nucleotidyltransferase with HDIG domain
MEVLQGRSDVLGPKFAGIGPDDAGALFFTVGPITSSGQVICAAVVGEPVADLLSQLSAGHQSIPLALYRIDGSLVGSTQGFPQQQGTIGTAERLWVIGRTGVVHHQADASGLSQIFFVPWDIRGEPFGYAAVVLPSSTVASAASNEARVLMLIFLCSLAVTVLGGLFVSRSITRPLSGLLQATRQVGAGNLHHRAPVGSTDEIGQLAESFNTMTAMLQERTQRLEFSSEATVQTLAAAIDARDPYTHGHSLRVAAYSEALGVAAGLDEEQMENVRRGCLVHDVGKIGVPDSILSKPGRLEAHEEREMREHPVVGYEMLRRLPWSHEAMEIVRNHHERWDGRGYPDRLRGERIPALARLVAVADSLDAMTSHRPYRRALSFSEAAMEIENGAGAQFDPQVVAAFRAVREELRRLKNTLSEEDAESTRLAG